MSTLKTNNIQHVDRSEPSILINTDGSVNIAGTMTYEDVTSVDAVGIITGRDNLDAQKQVHVGTGVSVKAGGINVTAGISTFGGDIQAQGDVSIVDTIYHAGDTNTKIRFPAADTISFETGGTERLSIESDGTFAFGNVTPGGNPAGKNVFLCIGDSDSGIVQDGDGQIEIFANDAEIVNFNAVNGSTFTGDVTIPDKIIHSGDTNTAIRFPAADTITAETGGSERIRIDSSGNCGIGTNNPDSKLHVYGATTGYAKIETGDGTTNPIVMHKNPDKIFHAGLRGDTSDGYVIRDATASANRLVIDTNGKICLGTHNTNFADNDGIVSIINAASGGTENTLLTLWNPTTAADARASIDFLTNAHYGTGRDGGFIRASNDGSSAAAHLIFGKINDETYTKTVKFDTSGDIEIVDGDLVIQTSGHGIDFSAAANSNAGASSSILNDYEEGVYQPTMTGSTSGSHTFQTYTHLAYTKIGRVVHIQGYINTNGGTLTGNLKLSLPFTVSNNATGHSRYPAIFISWRAHGWSGNTGVFTFAPQPNTNYGEIISVTPGGSHTWVNGNLVGNNYNIRVGGCYITDA